MNFIYYSIMMFVICLFVIELVAYVYKRIKYPNYREIRRRLKAFSSDQAEGQPVDITKRLILSEVPFLNAVLKKIPGIKRLERLQRQSGVTSPIGVFILFALVLALMGFTGTSIVIGSYALAGLVSLILCGIPFYYLLVKKKKRIGKFQSQFPEGLEFIARALKAGHAFTSGMKLAADEFDDPLGPEFGETLDEINFGVAVPEALKNLANRVDCSEIRFFVVSVILQRETGGNLADIIEGLANIIRERFKLQGKIRSLAAEGKLSAIILIALPFFIVFTLFFTSPKYIKGLITDPIGIYLIIGAVIMMGIGILIIKKMITIDV